MAASVGRSLCRVGGFACAAALALSALLLNATAGAAPATVTITDETFRPASVTVFVNDRVTWVNRTGEPVAFSVDGGQPTPLGPDDSTTRTFSAPGTYTVRADRLVGTDPAGTVVVRARPPSASPRPSVKPSARPSPTSRPTPPAASPEPTSTPTPGSSSVSVPPIGSGPPPTPPAASPEPTPQVAPPLDPPETGSGQPADRRSLIQAVPARAYGLPAALAVVLVLGVAAAIVRVLLAEPVRERSASG